MIPQFVQQHAQRLLTAYCRQRLAQLSAPGLQIDLIWSAESALIHGRSPRQSPRSIARFHYLAELRQWVLYAPADGEGWRPYLNINPSLDLHKLLRHLDADPFRLFWPPDFRPHS